MLIVPQQILPSFEASLKLANSHYENFPVASFLLPKKLRYPIAAIYAFARYADDIVDEGTIENNDRINQLNEMITILNTKNIPIKKLLPPFWPAILFITKQYPSIKPLLLDLIAAFKQDLEKKRYVNFDEIKNYCKLSANPVGRILLLLTKQDTKQNLKLSDNICTALQLINFYQDLESDVQQRNRLYIPQDEMQKFDITEEAIKNFQNLEQLTQLMLMQITRAKQMLINGKLLGKNLNGLFGIEIRATINAALIITDKLLKRTDVFARPTLTKFNLLYAGVKSVLKY